MQKYPANILKKIKENLLDEQKKLAERLNKLNLEDPFIDTERINDNAASDTDAKEEVDHERIEALKEEINTDSRAISEALVRIKKRTYGFCEKCGKMIDTDRLNIYPTAKFCMSCEKKNGRKA